MMVLTTKSTTKIDQNHQIYTSK